ncbi:MAG: hypothetical protein HQM15_10855 [Deltaproteobacteria bacterium]|nr:hypothetical protein [Deltaproteobacteria bacterium]
MKKNARFHPATTSLMYPKVLSAFLVLCFCLQMALISTPVVAEESAVPETSQTLPETSPKVDDLELRVIKRIPKMEMFPCTECHSGPADFNTTQRELTKEHLDKILDHGQELNGGWCHNCHTEGRYIRLHLRDGKEIAFNQAYLLCGGCHGPEFNDWKKNIHGKRIGGWNLTQQIYSCPECHDPHKPAFKPLKPLPPPNDPRAKDLSPLQLIFGKVYVFFRRLYSNEK